MLLKCSLLMIQNVFFYKTAASSHACAFVYSVCRCVLFMIVVLVQVYSKDYSLFADYFEEYDTVRL